MTQVPESMKAYKIVEAGKPGVIRDVAVPTPADDELLVKISHVSLNPTDWKHLYTPGVGVTDATLGCDFAGTIVSIGSNAAPRPDGKPWSIGDQACGFVHGGKFENKGSFAEYAVVKADQIQIVPENLSIEAAPTYGVAFQTAGMGVPYPPGKVDGQKYYLVSGGSTSVGLYLIPLLKLAGLSVIATASPRSFDLVKSYGADHVVDYHDTEAALAEIEKITNGQGVWKGLECVGGDENFKLSVKAFGKQGGELTTLTLVPESANKIREDVKIDRILLYTALGYEFEFLKGQITLPAMPKDKEWHKGFVKHAVDLMGPKYAVKPNPLDVRHGLENVIQGLDDLKANKVSGKKIVYQIA